MGDFYIKEFHAVNNAGKKIDAGLKHLQQELVQNNTIDECINSILSCYTVDGTKNDHDCLVYNKELRRIEMDRVALGERTFPKYMSQFYYHQDKLVKVLERDLGIECIIIDLSEADGNSESKALEDKEVDLETVHNCIAQAIQDPDLKEVLDREICKLDIQIAQQPQQEMIIQQDIVLPDGTVENVTICIDAEMQALLQEDANPLKKEIICKERVLEDGTVVLEDCAPDPLAHLTREQRDYFHEVSNILLSRNGKTVAAMLKASQSSNDVTNICNKVISCNSTKQLKTTYNEYVRERYIAKISKKTTRGLIQFLTQEMSYKEIVTALGETESKKVFEISNSPFAKLLKTAVKFRMNIEQMLSAIANGQSAHGIKKMIIAHQHKICNRHYIEGNKEFLLGLSGTEQLVVLETLYRVNEAGNTTQTRLTQDILQNLARILTKAREKYSSKLYTTKDALDLCKSIFTLRSKENDFMITGLA